MLYALVAGSYAAWKRRRRLALSAQNALLAAFPVTLVAAIVLLVALGRRDMTFVYVWQHTSHKLPLGYALSAFWGGQEGSLLLWLLVLTGYAGLAVWLNRRSRELIAWTVPVFGLIAVFFAFMLCFVSSPFSVQPLRPDGNGMVPSLQNPYMLAHPPLLYLGYVGLSVPFAFAMGALLSGRTDERWIVATRRWTLAAWTFLGVGQLIGAHWAYVEIGWGGYYAWDPVENAALMPWLAATAFLHSVMIQEKRGMLKVWNMILVALAFNLSLFGTFITRSGVINSIHSFSKSSIGGWFLAFLGLMVFGSIALIRWRLPLLRTKTKLESLVSREATFLYNNLLLVALCLTILWGVLYPILTDAVRGESRSVAGPYYDFFLHTFGLPLLLLMGLGPLVAWRRASLRSLGKTFVIPFTVAVVTGVVLLALGFGSSWPGLLTYTFSAFVAASIVLEFVRGRAAAGGVFRLIARNRRRYGGYVGDRDRGLQCVPDAARADPATGTVGRSRGLHVHVHGAQRCERTELQGLPRAARGVGARRALPSRSRGEPLLHRGRRERGVHLSRPALDRRRLHDGASRSEAHDQHRPQDLREAARQPHLGGRLRVRGRRTDCDVARRGRAAPTRRALRGRRRPRGYLTCSGRSPLRRCSRSSPSSSSRARSSATPLPRATGSTSSRRRRGSGSRSRRSGIARSRR
ncbi:MAG: heme lyase CcmF/NrfE family subunit [Actinobacteria bacterium]|nr:MAG: heme lyase CcmF/NrfE family subunit [Actinomycetota bacterium]